MPEQSGIEHIYPTQFSHFLEVLKSVDTINDRLAAQGHTDLLMTERANVMVATTPEDMARTDNFASKLARFVLNVGVLADDSDSNMLHKFSERAAFKGLMGAYKLAGLNFFAALGDSSDFVSRHAQELAVLGFTENNLRRNAQVWFGITMTHAVKPAFWRMYSLFPEETHQVLRHNAQYDPAAAVAEDPRILQDKEAYAKVQPSPNVGLFAYNIMARLIDVADRSVVQGGVVDKDYLVR